MRFLVVFFFFTLTAQAHEVRPSYLEITERGDGTISIVWKQPAGVTNTSLAPKFSTGWTDVAPLVTQRQPEALVQTWRVKAPHAPLAGATIAIPHLEQTITDVLVRVTYSDGIEVTRVLEPTEPRLTIPEGAKAAPSVRECLLLGFTHIWSGIDHLLYVLGL